MSAEPFRLERRITSNGKRFRVEECVDHDVFRPQWEPVSKKTYWFKWQARWAIRKEQKQMEHYEAQREWKPIE